jgi:sterol desaturase/sphingolipid hydroxylase (fatty acid hydroxylase superfamily)
MTELIAKIGFAGTVAVAAAYAVLLVFEGLYPLRQRTRPRAGRFAVNAVMTAFTFLGGSYVVRAVGMGLSFRVDEGSIGLLHLAPIPFYARFALGFLLMDLSFYYWHRANHEVGILWRFHNVHHVDPDLDVTTSVRFHLGEVLYSSGFRAVQVFLIGVSPLTYAVYEMAFTCETAFHHSNLRLPLGVERVIGKVIVTPRMHGIHHSALKEETNSNYGTIFRWWDLLHRTLRLGVRQSEVHIGVPAYTLPGDNRLSHILTLPFIGQRDYWRMPDGTRPARTPVNPYLMLE